MFKLAHDFWFASNSRFGRCATLIAIFKSLRRTPSLVIDQAILWRICGSNASPSGRFVAGRLTDDANVENHGPRSAQAWFPPAST
jgi:hypothetical protein